MCNVGMKDDVHEQWEAFDDPHERLAAVANHLVRENPEATFYDLFNFIREDIFKGWRYDEESSYIRGLDAEIDYAFRKKGFDFIILDEYEEPKIKIVPPYGKFYDLNRGIIIDPKHPQCGYCGRFTKVNWDRDYLTGPCPNCYESRDTWMWYP